MADNMFNKFKRVLGFGEDYDDYDDYDDDYEEDYTEKNEEPEVKSIKTKRSSNNVTNLRSSNLVITVHEPLSYEESPAVVDDLRDNKAVVLNFEQLDVDVKRQIFDFVSGALYALDGEISKVNKDIFILAPYNVEIDGLKDELKNNGVFPW
ncbi:cell division protein SepF [Peptoniphilus sp. GNH]|nr:hypothetical protein HMPREF3189_00145 [Clostridiales bacterium KA00134]UHR03108.1 cell division protein SepF [Peptoniphilus sp. GNH]